jgi:hypothetical protein
MILSWGKPKIEICPSVNGAPQTPWVVIDTPKQDTTNCTGDEGDKTEAFEEGGERVDVMKKKNTATLKYDLFIKKNKALPFNDEDGIVSGEYAVRITPEDPNCVGILIERSAVSVQTEYTAADGLILHVTHEVLKPAAGKMVKQHINGTPIDTNANFIKLNQNALTFTVGDANTVTLVPSYYPTSNVTVNYVSLDTNVAEVTSGGVVSASDAIGATAGTTAIIASIVVDGVVYSDSCIVTVNNAS